MLKFFQRRMQDDKGFTLIELMVVVLIIAILIAIAIPTFLGLRERSQNRSAQSDLRNGMTAAKSFYTDSDSYTGFTAAQGESIEPSLNWVSAAPVTGEDQVQVTGVSGTTVVLNTRSANGDGFCIADNSDPASAGTVRGVGVAGSYTECAGFVDW